MSCFGRISVFVFREGGGGYGGRASLLRQNARFRGFDRPDSQLHCELARGPLCVFFLDPSSILNPSCLFILLLPSSLSLCCSVVRLLCCSVALLLLLSNLTSLKTCLPHKNLTNNICLSSRQAPLLFPRLPPPRLAPHRRPPPDKSGRSEAEHLAVPLLGRVALRLPPVVLHVRSGLSGLLPEGGSRRQSGRHGVPALH